MADEIELISDGEGVAVIGELPAIKRFLDQRGLMALAQEFDVGKLRRMLDAASDVFAITSAVMGQAAFWVKLTPESAARLREAGGLMPTRVDGISHVMLGKTGTESLNWLQAEDGPASILLNPAVLSGLGGLLGQAARRAEAQELKALLVKIDQKLGLVLLGQRNEVLAKMHGAAGAIEEATALHERGGDPRTAWGKVCGVSESILGVQNRALLELQGLAERVERMRRLRDLKRTAEEKEIELDVAFWLSVLVRCFELQDEFAVLELDYVLTTSAESVDGHRLGLRDSLEKRRSDIFQITTRIMDQMDVAGRIAKENSLLHPRIARSVIASVNSTAELVDDFHAPLGIESSREVLVAVPRREAIRDSEQRKTAAKEAGLKGGAAVGSLGVAAVGTKVVRVLLKLR